MIQERGWAGTFFLNVYEHHKWGDLAMKEVAVQLQLAGQDVALHTHPQWAYDSSRNAMWQYSLAEQMEIIRDGVRLLKAWTGQPVVAHRAGDYTADENTLEALQGNGIRLDSSLFWGHPRCHLTGLGMPRNLPSYRGPLLEIPVTVYRRIEIPRVFGELLGSVSSVRKIDPSWFLDAEEARAAIDAVIEANPPFLVVFLHSFSFIKQGHINGPLEPDVGAREIFRVILDHIAEKHLEVVTMRDLAQDSSSALGENTLDSIPVVSVSVELHRYLWHRLRAVGTSGIVIGVAISIAIATIAVWVQIRRRFARGRAVRAAAQAKTTALH